MFKRKILPAFLAFAIIVCATVTALASTYVGNAHT